MASTKARAFATISKVMVKRKASSEKVCQFMVETVMAPSVEASEPERPAEQGQTQRFGEERAQNGGALETQCPEGADLGGPVGDRGIHRGHGAHDRQSPMNTPRAPATKIPVWSARACSASGSR